LVEVGKPEVVAVTITAIPALAERLERTAKDVHVMTTFCFTAPSPLLFTLPAFFSGLQPLIERPLVRQKAIVRLIIGN
jgi:hypothetical protein